VTWRTGSTLLRNRGLPSSCHPTTPQAEACATKISEHFLFPSGLCRRDPVAFGLLVFFLGFCGWFAGGCNKSKKPLSAGDIHAITREFVAAATTVGVSVGDLKSYPHASDPSPSSSDDVDITIRPKAGDPSGGTTRVLQALGGIATKHGLTQEGPSENDEGVAYRYGRGGFPTHTIHIHFGPAAISQESPFSGKARLAIILDDLGNDRSAAEAIFALPYPLTISVLPNHPHSVEIAEDAHRRGYEVMLHLPMESVVQGKPESQELRPGMSGQEVSALVNEFLRAVPDVAGANNHQGSQSTTDVALMEKLMPVLREHKLFYIDSRTTAATVAFDAARRAGVASAFRNVPFLDDVAAEPAVRKQLELALREAAKKGEAIAIGHPHSATLKALREVLPEAQAAGVRLVFASELVH
jgi:polysaccharide deacetylase 2 family uncharacterized protein YibQ